MLFGDYTFLYEGGSDLSRGGKSNSAYEPISILNMNLVLKTQMRYFPYSRLNEVKSEALGTEVQQLGTLM